MPIPIIIPRLGWNMEVGTFIEWLKADGDAIRPGEAVFKLEGEKSVEEVESLDSGILHIPADGPKPGNTVAVGAVIGYLLQPGETPPGSKKQETIEAATPRAEPAASPSVRRMARERGIELEQIAGTGPGGRIRAEDLPKRDVSRSETPAISPRARRLAASLGIDWSKLQGSGQTGRIRERDVRSTQSPQIQTEGVQPLSPIRKTIASRMRESRESTAPVTLFSTVDVTNLVNLRGQFKAASDGKPIPTYTDFLVKLLGIALQKHPLLAARWMETGIELAKRIDIGVAVDTDAGLLVPVLRDVPTQGLRQLAEQSRGMIERARRGELPMRDMQGGCFTITNLGAYGIDAFTPIINPPECAILGVGRIQRRAVMEGERVIGREQMTLCLTFDHRIVDGAPAARFLQSLAQLVENPGPSLVS